MQYLGIVGPAMGPAHQQHSIWVLPKISSVAHVTRMVFYPRSCLRLLLAGELGEGLRRLGNGYLLLPPERSKS